MTTRQRRHDVCSKVLCAAPRRQSDATTIMFSAEPDTASTADFNARLPARKEFAKSLVWQDLSNQGRLLLLRLPAFLYKVQKRL